MRTASEDAFGRGKIRSVRWWESPRAARIARNMELMQTLDDAWNGQNVEILRARHKPDVIVRWPGQPDPTVGIDILEENLPRRGRPPGDAPRRQVRRLQAPRPTRLRR